jgi:hypothetical protein
MTDVDTPEPMYVLTVQLYDPCAGGPPCASGGAAVYLFKALPPALREIPERNGDEVTWEMHDAHGKTWTASARRGSSKLWYTVHEVEVR